MTPAETGAGWIERLGLAAHPEGGFFRRIHTDTRQAVTTLGTRPVVTSIYYLLTREAARARLHRNRAGILHYLLDGGPVDYLVLAPGGSLECHRLERERGDALFLEVPGLHWKASELAAGAAYALIAEAVVPGWDAEDHEFATQALLDTLAPALQQRLAPFVASATA